IAGATNVTLVEAGGLTDLIWSPADFGLSAASLESLAAEDPAASAELIRRVLAGKPGPAREIVVINAAAALWVAGLASDLRAAARRAVEVIDSGAAREVLARLVETTRF